MHYSSLMYALSRYLLAVRGDRERTSLVSALLVNIPHSRLVLLGGNASA